MISTNINLSLELRIICVSLCLLSWSYQCYLFVQDMWLQFVMLILEKILKIRKLVNKTTCYQHLCIMLLVTRYCFLFVIASCLLLMVV